MKSGAWMIPAVRVVAAAGLAVSVSGLLGGCSSDAAPRAAAGARSLASADFAAAPGEATVAVPPAAPPTQPASAPPSAAATTPTSPAAVPPAPKPTPPDTIQLGVKPATPITTLPETAVTPGPPEPSPTAKALDKPLVIDSLVGQINGKPVFASEILEPLHGQLRALAEQSRTRADFTKAATQVIGRTLQLRINDELFLSEARRNLPVEVRTGLFHILNDIQNSFVSQQRGSEVAADEAIRQSEGKSLRAESQGVLDRELIQNEVRQRITPRVQVSWRDIRQEYERRHDKYNPPAIAHMRFILVGGPTKSADAKALETYQAKVAEVRSALAGGATFPDVAAKTPNEYARRTGGKEDRTFAGDFGEGTYSAVDEVNTAARTLSAGQWVGPIVYTDAEDKRERTVWVFLESIERPPSVPLADVQLEIEQSLQEDRRQKELSKYIDRLKSRGSVSSIEEMAAALVQIAVDRYVPPSRK